MSFLVTGFLSIFLPLLVFLCTLYNKSWFFTSALVLLMYLFYFTIVLLSMSLYVVTRPHWLFCHFCHFFVRFNYFFMCFICFFTIIFAFFSIYKLQKKAYMCIKMHVCFPLFLLFCNCSLHTVTFILSIAHICRNRSFFSSMPVFSKPLPAPYYPAHPHLSQNLPVPPEESHGSRFPGL